MSVTQASQGAGVRGVINYVRNPVSPGATPLTFVTEDESQSTMVTLPGEPVWIGDMRGQECALDREGFTLARHVTAVSDFRRIETDNRHIDSYNAEMAGLLKQLTGASLVIPLGSKQRYGPSATDKLAGLPNALPALYPHGDTTDPSALDLAQRIMQAVPGVELDHCRRWAHYNMWRAITPPPQDYPLAVCDARSLAPADRETVVAITETPTVPEMVFDTTGYLHNPAHRWCYFSDMTPEEVLVFITHDSDPVRPHQVAHSAFLDPTCPPGTPTRGSVETRALALFF